MKPNNIIMVIIYYSLVALLHVARVCSTLVHINAHLCSVPIGALHDLVVQRSAVCILHHYHKTPSWVLDNAVRLQQVVVLEPPPNLFLLKKKKKMGGASEVGCGGCGGCGKGGVEYEGRRKRRKRERKGKRKKDVSRTKKV